MAEGNAGRVTPVLATDAQLKVGTTPASRSHCHTYQGAHAFRVDGGEGVGWEYPFLNIPAKELALGVIAAETVGHLRQVIGAEAEEVRLSGDFSGDQGGPGRLNHGAKLVGYGDA